MSSLVSSLDCQLSSTSIKSGAFLPLSSSGLVGNLTHKLFVWVSCRNRQRNLLTGTYPYPQKVMTPIVSQLVISKKPKERNCSWWWWMRVHWSTFNPDYFLGLLFFLFSVLIISEMWKEIKCWWLGNQSTFMCHISFIFPMCHTSFLYVIHLSYMSYIFSICHTSVLCFIHLSYMSYIFPMCHSFFWG